MNKTEIIVYDTPEANHEEGAPSASMFDYMVILSRYRALLLGIIITGSLIIAGYLMVMPQTFATSATLLPPDKAEGMSLTNLVQSSTKFDFKGLSENSSSETLVRIIGSRAMADSILRRFDLLKRFDMDSTTRSLAIDRVLGSYSLASDRQGFIDIAYSTQTGYFSSEAEQVEAKKLAADIVNATVEVLDRMNREKSISKARRTREFLGTMRIAKRNVLDSLQDRMQLFQQKHKAFAIDDQTRVSMDNLISLQAEIYKAEIELVKAQNEFTSGPVVDGLNKQLATLRRQFNEMKSGRIGGEKETFTLPEVPELMREYVNLKLDLEVTTQLYTYLEMQYNQEQVQEARDLPTVAVLDWARPPVFRSAPRRTLFLLVGVVMLSFFSTLLVFIVHGVRERWGLLDRDRRLAVRSLIGFGGRK